MLIRIAKSLIRACLNSVYVSLKYPSCKISSYIPHGCSLGDKVIICRDCTIGGGVRIDDYTFIHEGTRIDSNTKYIGKYCSISHNVKIGLGPHPSGFFSTSPLFYSSNRGLVPENLYDEYEDKGYTEIGHDVLIGANAIIMAGVKVGTGAIIGAGSVVTKDVPPYAIVAGNEARILKYRFEPQLIELLLQSEWWNKDLKRLATHLDLIDKPEMFIKNLVNGE